LELRGAAIPGGLRTSARDDGVERDQRRAVRQQLHLRRDLVDLEQPGAERLAALARHLHQLLDRARRLVAPRRELGRTFLGHRRGLARRLTDTALKGADVADTWHYSLC